jgi:hypothetical protein
MTPEFELIREGPERDFLGCRMRLAEKILAREIEAELKLEPGDIKVVISGKDEPRYVKVYRVIPLIDCSKNLSWLGDVEDCLKSKRSFDVLNATKVNISQLDHIIQPYADWFKCSESNEPSPRRKFRLIT